jgi:hypothetical protein
MILVLPQGMEIDGRDLGDIVPNGRGSMAVNFGEPVTREPSRASDVRDALDRYETFHKKTPKQLVRLDPKHAIPTQVDRIGELLSVAYRTDKWYDDGADVDYRHVVEEGGQTLFEPKGSHSWAKKVRLPVAPPKTVTLLGKSLGLFVRREDNGQVYEGNPRDSYLFCSPSGNMLLLYSPSQGFLAMACGGKLSVKEHGIDG